MPTLAFVVLAYLIGSISFAVVTSRVFGLPDPRTYGSGNPGATNVLRSGKKLVAALTLVGDLLKGVLAVWVARRFGPEFGAGAHVAALAGLAAFLGHLYPVFFRFRGGKGVATAGGILFALSLPLGTAALAAWLVSFAATRVSSLGALAAAVAAPLAAVYFFGWGVETQVVLAMAALLVWRHRENIRKLLSGTEKKIV